MAKYILQALSGKESTKLNDDFEGDIDNLDLEKKESDLDSKVTTTFDETLFPEMSELHPKMNTIFADIQSSIPSLDFEVSSVSYLHPMAMQCHLLLGQP